MGIIYCVKNLVNGKRYIGQTVGDLEKRKQGHLLSLKNKCRYPLYLAIIKYGLNSFEWTIIFDDVLNRDLDELEIDAISVYNTLAPNGYNLKTGGANGRYSEESRRRMSEAARGNPKSSWTEERKQKLSQKKKGVKRSPEDMQGLLDHQKNRPPWTEEHKRRISETLKGRVFTEEHRQKLKESWIRRKSCLLDK